MSSATVWLEITAGQGPAECAWAVVRTARAIEREAAAAGLAATLAGVEAGPEPGTARSMLLRLDGEGAETFGASWRGTVQWIARSPFRPAHPRKNWFVGVALLSPPAETNPDLGPLRWDTMRASGPGGQHVNRTESAVRVTHLGTGLQVTAQEERSQRRNRELALARLAARLAEHAAARVQEARRDRWLAHHSLERGNPVRILRDERRTGGESMV